MNEICRKCKGKCCRMLDLQIVLTDKDFIKWLGFHKDVMIDVDGRLVIFRKCRFLNGEGKCVIYDERPKICRDFMVMSAACCKARRLIE